MSQKDTQQNEMTRSVVYSVELDNGSDVNANGTILATETGAED